MTENTSLSYSLKPIIFITLVGALYTGACKKSSTGYDPEGPCQCDTLAPTGSNSIWEGYYGTDTSLPGFPDQQTNFWVYSFELPNNQTVISLKGIYPHCRHFSIGLYDYVTGEKFGYFQDKDIRPACCNINPYLTYSANEPMYYRVDISGQGNQAKARNVLTSSHNKRKLTLFYRCTAPQGDNTGGVELPRLTSININTGEETTLPAALSLLGVERDLGILNELQAFFQVQIDDNKIRFYFLGEDRFFDNSQDLYLATPITRKPNEIFVIRFKAPMITDGILPIGEGDIRYWSFNLNDSLTRNRGATNSNQAIIASDGFVNIVIGDGSPEVAEKAIGLNLLNWSHPGNQTILVYRNLAPATSFEGNFNKVKQLSGANPLNILTMDARSFIKDFAPQGQRMSREAFLTNFGGISVSYPSP